MKKRRFTEEQIVRMLRTTVSGGGTESDGRMFVFGNYLDEVLVSVIPAQAPNQDLYYAHDHLYSPTVLYGPIGIAVERYEYDAYGSVQILTSAFYPLASSQYGNPYTFTGRELDTMDNNTLHLMYYRARTYDPETGRFMQRDPLGVNPDGKHKYDPVGQYKLCNNLYEGFLSNPVGIVDFDGYMPKKCCQAVLPKLLNNSGVRPYYDKAKKAKDLNNKPCLKDIKCKKCPPNVMGSYDPKKRIIVLCTHEGPEYGLSEVKETLIHELVHAIQCDPSRNCGHCMRKEIEAYYTAGSCDTEKNWSNNISNSPSWSRTIVESHKYTTKTVR